MSDPTDNANLEAKVQLRASLVSSGCRVLDAFSGEGHVWRNVGDRIGGLGTWTRVDQRRLPGVIHADNLRVLSGIDLSNYDVIDLDAYGDPTPHLSIVTRRGFKGLVFLTAMIECNASYMRPVSFEALDLLGIPRQWARDHGRLVAAWDLLPEAWARLGWPHQRTMFSKSVRYVAARNTPLDLV